MIIIMSNLMFILNLLVILEKIILTATYSYSYTITFSIMYNVNEYQYIIKMTIINFKFID